MMHRVVNQTNPAVALQAAADLRRSQTAASTTTSTAQQTAASAQYNFAAIFGQASDERGPVTTSAAAGAATTATGSVPSEKFSAAIATATATVMEQSPAATRTPLPQRTTSTTTAPTSTDTTSTSTPTSTTSTTTTSATAATTAPAAETTGTDATTAVSAAATNSSAGTGIQGLVSAIMSGNFQASYVTNPAQLQEINPAGTDYMPNFYYASDQTANQLASILGGTVVKMPPFGQDQGWTEPDANFIQLPNGQTFNAADVAYYANTSNAGPEQLTADITATINEGAAWTNYYTKGGAMPTFPEGYVGAPIAGMTYPSAMIGSDGNVINPAMPQPVTPITSTASSATQG